jgi:Ni/Fe-hydrogenase subunit HybB-like protein
MEKLKPIGGKIWTKPFQVLTVLAVIGVVFLIKRFVFGLGDVTGLNDGYPWGLWIVYDVVTGTAIACGGYAMAALVYIFNKGEYHPLVRSALAVSVLGYTLASFAIIFDVGRYWQLYNVFMPDYFNPHSAMFEVASCISLYIIVMWIEFSPAFLERFNKPKLLKIVNKLMFIFIGLGVLLPTMHQSSLGTLMIAAGEKLSPLFQTMFLPLLFLITAITMGYAIVIFESLFSSYGLKRPAETAMLSKLAKTIPWLIAVFFILRLGDIIYRGAFGLIFKFDLASIMFWIEMLMMGYAMVVLFSEANRKSTQKLFITAIVMVLAGALYRFDTFIVVFSPGHGYHYFPAFQEIMITVGVIAMEIMAYLVVIKRLPVLPEVKHA